MTSNEQKLKLFKKELGRLERRKAKAQAVIDSKSPAARYFEITDSVTDSHGKFKMYETGFRELIDEGARIERNLPELEDKHFKAVDKAWKSMVEIDSQILNLKSEIYYLNLRTAKGA
jgi:predicted  nucleic acid-binding Zn-ribbon protein